MYHMDNNEIAIGQIVGLLDYANPYLSPFEEFQRFKTHPAIAKYLKGGKRISRQRACDYGGRDFVPCQNCISKAVSWSAVTPVS